MNAKEKLLAFPAKVRKINQKIISEFNERIK